MFDNVKPVGEVECIIEYNDGRPKETYLFKNEVLDKGRQALAKILANDFGTTMDFYISRMLFGTNGTIGGQARVVEKHRTGLFGATLLSKAVISSINPNLATQVILTAVVSFDEGVGSAINEMALEMNNEELYSMVTFQDINKTSSMQMVFNWKITMM